MRFQFPLAFFLLILVPVIVYVYYRSFKSGILFSTTTHARQLSKSLKQRLLHLPLFLRIIALILIVLAMARLQAGKEIIHDVSKGIAIEMVVDRSGSMQLMKNIDGSNYNRLDIVKKAFKEFVNGNKKNLKGRYNDLIGMVVFARYADTVCPLTLSHEAVNKFIDNVKIVTMQSEDGTSVGDAIALAAARLKTAEETLKKQTGKEKKEYQIKSKIIILLTDGQDTGIGERTPLEAAELAKEWGIKIYSIGLSGRGWFIIQEDPLFGRQKIPYDQPMNTQDLQNAAEMTGGIFRLAEDIESLRDIYQEIDTMEKSEIESVRYMEYNELFVPFALLGLFFILLEVVLSGTVFRRIP
jgi:Ca-activated chloride channel family protein